MNIYERIASMFTFANICFVMMYPWLSPVLQDIVRGTSFLILIMVSTIWFSGHVQQTYIELFDSFHLQIMGDSSEIQLEELQNINAIHSAVLIPNANAIPTAIKLSIIGICDILFHVVPCFLIGLPNAISIIITYMIMVVWYVIKKDKIADIYAPSVNAKRAFIITGVVAVMFVLIKSM